MKRVSNLYKDISNLDNIIDMTDKVLSKVKNKELKEKFILHKMEHVINIKNNKLILKLRNSTKYKFKKNIKLFKLLYKYSYINEIKYNLLLSSFKGHLNYGNCNSLYYSVI